MTTRKSNPLARAIARNVKAQPGCPTVLAALRAVTDRIDANSGSPTFTADEHQTLVDLLARYPNKIVTGADDLWLARYANSLGAGGAG